MENNPLLKPPTFPQKVSVVILVGDKGEKGNHVLKRRKAHKMQRMSLFPSFAYF